MKRLLIALMLALPSSLAAQKSTQPIVVYAPAVRNQLAEDWTEDPNQIERGYCAAYKFANVSQGHVVYMVTDIRPADQDSTQKARTNVHQIEYTCTQGALTISVHTHPPATCVEWVPGHFACSPDGMEAYECFPSDVDQNTLNNSTEPFALLQCDRHAIVAYFPTRNTKDGNYVTPKIPVPDLLATHPRHKRR